jgi:Arc/MetJ family transcription regulator
MCANFRESVRHSLRFRRFPPHFFRFQGSLAHFPFLAVQISSLDSRPLAKFAVNVSKRGSTVRISYHLDTIAPLHHGASMRLTINLDDDLYAMARSHAIATKTSISKAVGDLLRRNISSRPATAITPPNIHPESGFPISVSGSKPFTNEDVRRMTDDDLVRPLEIAGYSPEQIEEMLNQ